MLVMKDYLRWMLRQLYLIFFWPTQFRREVEGDSPEQAKMTWAKQVRYLRSIFPFLIVLAVLGTAGARYIYNAVGIAFHWENTLIGMAVGLALFMAGALAGAVPLNIKTARGVALFVTVGVSGAVAFALMYVLADAVALYVGLVKADTFAFAVAIVGAFAIAFGASDSVPFGVTAGLTFGVVFGVAFGVPFGLAGNAEFGLPGGMTVTAIFWLIYFRLITYPFDVALDTITYYAGRRHPQEARRFWRRSPVAWNELIWLPLPFADKLLVLLARQDREEGFRQIAFVAAERPLQRRVAFAALAEVAAADLKAETLSQLSDVTDRLSWTTDAPANLPGELAVTLPRFDRVAQHVGQYLTLHSAYRKRESLERALKEVEALQRSLIVARGRFSRRMLQAVNEWRGLLDAERDKVRALAEASREIPNPFAAGNPVMETEQNVFTGRRDVVQKIEANLLGAAQAPTLLLQGPRRMGKTSILNQLPRLLGPDFAPAVVDCQDPAVRGSEATLLKYLSRALSEGLRRRRVQVEALAAQQLAREPYAAFDEWLEKVESAMPVGMRALLCLDEYERLQSALEAGWGTSFLDALRHTFQHRPRVVLMFTGAHTFQELGPAWTDRFVSARRMRVSFLAREDVELLLTKPIPEFDMTYAAGALDALVAATNCHPFLTQAVAFELVQLLNEGQRREATTADVEESIRRALGSGEAYFANVWVDAGPKGQAILSALATGRTPPEFPAASAWLREHDVIGADGDFAVEMLRRWVVAKAAKL